MNEESALESSANQFLTTDQLLRDLYVQMSEVRSLSQTHESGISALEAAVENSKNFSITSVSMNSMMAEAIEMLKSGAEEVTEATESLEKSINALRKESLGEISLRLGHIENDVLKTSAEATKMQIMVSSNQKSIEKQIRDLAEKQLKDIESSISGLKSNISQLESKFTLIQVLGLAIVGGIVALLAR